MSYVLFVYLFIHLFIVFLLPFFFTYTLCAQLLGKQVFWPDHHFYAYFPIASCRNLSAYWI